MGQQQTCNGPSDLHASSAARKPSHASRDRGPSLTPRQRVEGASHDSKCQRTSQVLDQYPPFCRLHCALHGRGTWFAKCSLDGVTDGEDLAVKGSKYTNPDHQLRRSLVDAVAAADGDPDEAAELVLRTLNDRHIISYGPPEAVKLLAPAGRALMIMLERPHVTVSEMASVLGVSQGNASTAISALVQGKVIIRTRTGGGNQYEVSPEALREHPDVTRLLTAITSALGLQVLPVPGDKQEDPQKVL